MRDFWINRLYFDISNLTNKQCMPIDNRDVDNLGPAKVRTQANNKRGKSFNSFLVVKKQTSQANEIIFLL